MPLTSFAKTVALFCLCYFVACGSSAATHADKLSAGITFFETKIRPVLVEKCYSCHSADAKELQAGLWLDSRAGVLKGGDSGPAIVPGNPAESVLISALKYESYEMPPDGQLPPAVIADFERWINLGAPDPREGSAATPTAGIDIEQGRKFWSFQPVTAHAPPPVKNAAWPTSPSDQFILAKLEARGLQPAADADRSQWLRRATFALIGLPPTIDELDAFAADTSPQAYETAVDRLLASPHFGERWGRHWLDVARFAESSGGGRSLLFPEAWRYRDYVINAINSDKRLDQFIVEQIAGDQLPYATVDEQRELLIATAYLVLGAHNYEEQDKRALEMDVVDEQLDTIGRGLLGMTVACARCHDHKFDPIPTADYYALAGIFRSTDTLVHSNVSWWKTRPLPLTDAEKKLESQLATAESKNQKAAKARQRKLAKMKGAPAGPEIMAVADATEVEDCRICIRGSVRHRGPVVPRGVLQVVTIGDPPVFSKASSGRRELAEWIAARQNPLTARVYVNRVWHYLIGVGLVRTLDNFGSTGELPSHPELLDDLATRFMDGGWSTKTLVRELVLSRAYRMNSDDNPQAAAIDPENRLLWRMNRVRLDAESLRDAMLTVSGQIDLRIGGPNISSAKLNEKSDNGQSTEYEYDFADVRRSVYTPAFRNRMHELFEVFDFADPNSSVARRNVTTVSPQALLMLNSTFLMQQARLAAERALRSNNLSDEQRVEKAFRELLGRPPSNEERQIALAALTLEPGGAGGVDFDAARLDKWQGLYQGLFGCIDFRYLE
jgi:hypothetical protein